MMRYLPRRSRWPDRPESRSPKSAAVLRVGAAVAIGSIAAYSTADLVVWPPADPPRTERPLAAEAAPAHRIASRFWREQPAAVRTATVVKVDRAPVKLSARELTFKHGFALRHAAAGRQMFRAMPTTPPGGHAAKPQPASRADHRLRTDRRATRTAGLPGLRAPAARPARATRVIVRVGADRFAIVDLRSGRLDRFFAAPHVTQGMMSLRTPGGLY